MIVGPTIKWYITGQFEWKKIRVATGFANVRIYDGLYFHKLELYVEVSYSRNNFLVVVSSTTRKMIYVINSPIVLRDLKVPISSKVLFSHLILRFTQWTSAKKRFDLDKKRFCYECLKT